MARGGEPEGGSPVTCPLCRNEGTALYHVSELPRFGVREYRRCRSCDLIFVPERFHLSREEERKHYDSHENDPEDERYREFLSKLTKPLCERLAPGSRGLDFGCGPGPALCRILAAHDHWVENYDPIYFPNEALLARDYDFIAATEVIEHLRAPRETFRLLEGLFGTKGGALAFMTEVLEPEQDFANWWYPRDPTHICFYSLRTLEWIARQWRWELERPSKNVAIYSLRSSAIAHPAR